MAAVSHRNNGPYQSPCQSCIPACSLLLFRFCLALQAKALSQAQHVGRNSKVLILRCNLIEYTADQQSRKVGIDDIAQSVISLLESDRVLLLIQILVKDDIAFSSGNLVIRDTDINRNRVQ